MEDEEDIYTAETSTKAGITPPSESSLGEESRTRGGAQTLPGSETGLNEGTRNIIKQEIEEEINKKAQDLQIKYTEVLGVFVALFTFVSINIQIFNSISSLSNALIFVLLIFLCLSGFVYLIHLLLNQDNKEAKIFYILLTLFTLGIVILLGLFPNLGPLSPGKDKQITDLEQRVQKLEILQEFRKQ